MKVSGLVVVVSGANQGIGRATAALFAGLGAHVAVLDLAITDLQASVATGSPSTGKIKRYTCDVRSETQVSEAFEKVAADFGRLDVMVNNAGITRDALLIKMQDGAVSRRMTLEQWQTVMDVNLTGTFLCGREAATHMIRFNHGGVIINISSVSRVGNIGQSNYSASKAGVEALSVVWAKELARYNIRAASIAPGATLTDMVSSMKPEALQHMAGAVPLRRLGEVDEIAHAARFIVENDYYTGRCLELDGGLRF